VPKHREPAEIFLSGKAEGDGDHDPADSVVDYRGRENDLSDIAAQETHVAHHARQILTDEVDGGAKEQRWLGSGSSASGSRCPSNIPQANGTWKWQASNDGVSFTDLSSTFTLDDSTSAAGGTSIGDLSANGAAFSYYRMQQLAGTISSAQRWKEIEFKIMRG
jgi:hypothetical protein